MHTRSSDSPSISIVIPSYNHCSWICSCINSILIQKSKVDQLIVVDGNSDDGTHEVLKKYAKNIDHLIIEPDSGQADALHKGFSLATGDVLAYLNSDDIFLPGTFSFVREFFRNKVNVDAVYGNRVYIDKNDRPVSRWVIPFHSNYCHKRWDFIPQETCFWRSTLMKKVGNIDTSFQFAMDYDLFVRMMDAGRFKHVHRYLACFRDHPGSKTNTIYETTGKEEIRRIKNKYRIETSRFDRLIGNIYGQMIIQSGKLTQFFDSLGKHGRLTRQIANASKCKN